MDRFKVFTGGIFDTNCYWLETAEGGLLFDAPQGAAAHFSSHPVRNLILTHGHFDHVVDGAELQRAGARTWMHRETVPLVSDPAVFRRLGFNLEIETFEADELLDETPEISLGGETFAIFHVPGHCPGSLCFYHPATNVLIGGDVLFRRGLGRWDLPGGDFELLVSGIRNKLFAQLPDSVIVAPGHGPLTTLGEEKRENPWLAQN